MIEKLISECSDYDFKEELEEKKPRSWLKSVSAFANGVGGSLFFGVANDHSIIGLSDKVSEGINQRIEPKPVYFLIPLKEEGKDILQLKVNPGQSTPYYYKADGVCVAYVRSGDESIEAPVSLLSELILRGSNRTFDSVVTGHLKKDFSFAYLQAKFLQQTGTRFEERDFVSFGIANTGGMLTNAGLLLSDQPPFRSCRLIATRWNGNSKVNEEEASDDKEYHGSILEQLDNAINFFHNHTKVHWHKVNGQTIYQPEYDEGAVTEALVNAVIHRDYNNPGAEVCLNIYDDRIEISSPGGMYSGDRIPEKVDFPMESLRRNPVIADLFWRMRLMNQRGSGLENITNKTNTLFGDSVNHVHYRSTGSFFIVTIENAMSKKNTVTKVSKGIPLSKRESSIIQMMKDKPSVSMKDMANALHVSERTIARDIENLQKQKIVSKTGKTRDIKWIVKE